MKLLFTVITFVGLVLTAAYPSAKFHTVDQDHYDGTNTNTWQQEYYVNDTFFVPGSDAPVFVCVGGEGPPLDGSVVVDSVHCNVAVEWLEETGAIMFAVQHRYYGCYNTSACPVEDTKAPGALRYLSSRQALGDLAAFHDYASTAYGLKASNKWVSFGGSYPGMLAGWFRLKFPHLVYASVSSSAPVNATLNMGCYNDVTAQAYSVVGNGIKGSVECRKAIKVGHYYIGQYFESARGRRYLAYKFPDVPSDEWLNDKANQRAFSGYGVASFPSQGNDPSCTTPACDINSICVIMTNTSIGDEVDRLAAVKAAQSQSNVLKQHQEHVEMKISRSSRRRNTEDTEPDYWGYQTCTEFGFYQTCEVGSECFYTQGLDTLDIELEMCSSVFSISPEKVAENVHYSNIYYGALASEGSRILSVNGQIDPWHCLAILEPPNKDMPTLWVPGASHHAWTHPTRPTDQHSVIEARASIRKQIQLWLDSDSQ